MPASNGYCDSRCTKSGLPSHKDPAKHSTSKFFVCLSTLSPPPGTPGKLYSLRSRFSKCSYDTNRQALGLQKPPWEQSYKTIASSGRAHGLNDPHHVDSNRLFYRVARSKKDAF